MEKSNNSLENESCSDNDTNLDLYQKWKVRLASYFAWKRIIFIIINRDAN